MPKNLLQKVEEKYVFKISHYFWHIFVAIGSLALIGGVLILLWGVIPPGKDNVTKAEYPPVVQVEPDEVIAVLKTLEEKPKQTTTTPRTVTQTKPVTTPVTSTDPDERIYNQSLDSLKKLIPPNKYSWASSGNWYYPYGEQYYRYYRDRGYNVENYRQWIVTSTGIEEKLKEAFTESQAYSFKQKKIILDSYIDIVRRFSEEKRSSLIKTLTGYRANSVTETSENLKAVSESISNFDTAKTEFITLIINFGSRNPREGRAFISYTNKVLSNFHPDYRLDVLKSMIGSFYNYFNNRVDQQIEITDIFLKNLGKYQESKHNKALEIYYELMVNKNYERERRIGEIESDYSYALAQTDVEYEIAKVEKAELRLNGVYLTGGAISLIAVLALILVLLSIQRYVKRIEEKLQKSNDS